MFLTLKLPLKRGPRYPSSLNLTEDAPEVVPVNFYLLQGGVVKDIMRKSVISFGGWNIFYRFLTPKLPLKKVPRHPLSLNLTKDAPEVVAVNFYHLQGGVVKDIIRKSVIFLSGWNIFYRFLTLKLPLKRGAVHPLSLKLTEDAPEVVSGNFYLLQGDISEDIMRKSVIFFGGWNIFCGFLTLNLPLKRGPRGPLSLKLTEDAPEVVFVNFYLLQGGVVEDITRKKVIFFGGWNILYRLLTLKLHLKRGPRHPLSLKLTEDAP